MMSTRISRAWREDARRPPRGNTLWRPNMQRRQNGLLHLGTLRVDYISLMLLGQKFLVSPVNGALRLIRNPSGFKPRANIRPRATGSKRWRVRAGERFTSVAAFLPSVKWILIFIWKEVSVF